MLRLTDALLAEGHRNIVGWFETLRTCEVTNEWPAYAQQVVSLDVPAWMSTEDEDSDEPDDPEDEETEA